MEKGKKWKKIEAFCILLIVTLLLIFVRILYQPGTESERGELYTFSNGWYQLKDGKKTGTQIAMLCYGRMKRGRSFFTMMRYQRLIREKSCRSEEFRISWKSAWETGFSINIRITDLKKQADERKNLGRYFFAGGNRAGSVIHQLYRKKE